MLLARAYYYNKDLKEAVSALSDVISRSYLNYEAYLRRALYSLMLEGNESKNPQINEDIKRYGELIKKVGNHDPKEALYEEITLAEKYKKKYSKREIKILKKIYKRLKKFNN